MGRRRAAPLQGCAESGGFPRSACAVGRGACLPRWSSAEAGAVPLDARVARGRHGTPASGAPTGVCRERWLSEKRLRCRARRLLASPELGGGGRRPVGRSRRPAENTQRAAEAATFARAHAPPARARESTVRTEVEGRPSHSLAPHDLGAPNQRRVNPAAEPSPFSNE